MKVLIVDGGRRGRWTGYGSLARSLTRALHVAGFKIAFRDQVGVWDVDDPTRAGLEELAGESVTECDFALVISPPQPVPRLGVPAIIYTQNALADLPADWQSHLEGYLGVLVPGEFDRVVFDRYHPNVHVVPQIVEQEPFRSIPRYRDEGVSCFTTTFVGSYGFRKGLDFLFESVGAAFRDESCKLRLFLGASPSLSVSDLVARARRLPSNVELDVHAKAYSPQWMNRFYNQSDIVVTMSRGEGWCMPLHEALLAGVPVVAPDSTAMGEWLPPTGVLRIPTREVRLSEYEGDSFADGFIRRYGRTNSVFDVDVEAAGEMLLKAKSDIGSVKSQALEGSESHREANRPEWLASRLSIALDRVLEKESSLMSDLPNEPPRPPRPRTEVFARVYETNKWGSSESISGPGSSLKSTASVRAALPILCRGLGVRTLLDAPCGDFNWMATVDLPIDMYFGCDIVPDLIAGNAARHGQANREFFVADICEDDLPRVDLALVRDVLVHLESPAALAAFANVASVARYILTTTFPLRAVNTGGSTGGWRPINLCLPPFDLPTPLLEIPESRLDIDRQYSDKRLALWESSSVLRALGSRAEPEANRVFVGGRPEGSVAE